MVKKELMILMLLLALPFVYGIEVNSSTEIYTFNVTGCQANETDVGCPDAWIRFSCSISNYVYIDYADYRIDGTDYTASRSDDHFWYDWHKGVTIEDTSTTIDFERGTIYDVSNGTALFFPSVNVSLECDACDYNITYHNCTLNDTRTVEYAGDGSPNCTSHNETENCDYCAPSWEITSDCLANNTELRTYYDSFGCYGITGLYSDSCGYTFPDCSQWINCSYLRQDMSCGYDSQPLIEIAGNRIFWYCSINETEESHHCISYVKEAGYTVQTNPQQKTFSSGIFAKEQETREFFTAQNGLVNPYFTTDNLKHNTTYIFGVECSSSGAKIVEEHYVTPMFENLDTFVYRGVWVRENVGYIIGGGIVLVLLVLIAGWLLDKVR